MIIEQYELTVIKKYSVIKVLDDLIDFNDFYNDFSKTGMSSKPFLNEVIAPDSLFELDLFISYQLNLCLFDNRFQNRKLEIFRKSWVLEVVILFRTEVFLTRFTEFSTKRDYSGFSSYAF